MVRSKLMRANHNRWIRWFAAAAILVFLSGVSHSAVAQVGEAIGGAAATNEVVDNLFRQLDESIEKAKGAGDYIAASALGRMKEALKAWEQASKELLDSAFRDLDRTSQDLLQTTKTIVDEVLEEASVGLNTVERLTVNADNMIQNIPFGEKQSYLLNYSPRVIGPLDEETVRISLLGTNLDSAEPVVRVGQTEIRARIVGPTEGTVDIPVSLLQGERDSMVQHDLTVAFSSASSSSFLRFFGWRDDVSSQITIFRVPARLATYTVTATSKADHRNERIYESRIGKYEGINTEIVNLAHPPTDWNWVMDDARRNEFSVRQYGGEAGSCHQEIRWNGSTETGIKVSARVDEIRKLAQLFGTVNRKPGYVECGLVGPIYAVKVVDEKFSESGVLDWGKGAVLNLPPKCENVRITVSMFNGFQRVHSGAAREKYYEINGSNCSFALNPELPRGI